MAKVGFIGLGNMGGPMVRNLIKAGHSLKVYDLSEEAINFAVQAGAMATKSVKEASSEVDFVVTMVPVGSNVKEIFLENGILTAASPGTVMIDSSTIDVQSAQTVHEAAKSAGFNMIDAPVSGGVIGADAGTLTFMCGGDKESFEKAKPILQGMGKNIVHNPGRFKFIEYIRYIRKISGITIPKFNTNTTHDFKSAHQEMKIELTFC